MERRTFLKLACLATGAVVVGADLVDTLLEVPKHLPNLHWTGWKGCPSADIYSMQGLWRSRALLLDRTEAEHFWFVNLNVSESQRMAYWNVWDNAKRKNFMEGLLHNGILAAQEIMRKTEAAKAISIPRWSYSDETASDGPSLPPQVISFRSIEWLPWPMAGEIVNHQYPTHVPEVFLL